jgi:hypothetical protein
MCMAQIVTHQHGVRISTMDHLLQYPYHELYLQVAYNKSLNNESHNDMKTSPDVVA